MENHINMNNEIKYEQFAPYSKSKICNVIPSPFLLELNVDMKYKENDDDDFILDNINTNNITIYSESEDYLSNESSAEESPTQRVIPHYKYISNQPKQTKRHSIWKKHINKEQSTLQPNHSISILHILESYINETTHRQSSST